MKASTFLQTATVLSLCFCGVPVRGQTASSPEAIVDLNQGIYEYLQGQRYPAAIKRFDAVLEVESDNRTALLFRALSYGQVALIERERKFQERLMRSVLREVRELLADEPRRQTLQQQVVQVEEKLKDPQLDRAEKLVCQSELQSLSDIVYYLGEFEGQPERLDGEIERANAQVQHAAAAERSSYQRMLDDAKALFDIVDSPQTVVALLEMMSLTKIARIDEFRAFDIVDGGAVGPGETSVGRLRRATTKNLQRAAEVLEEYLKVDSTGPMVVRIKFFLGVIRFRQAVPRRAAEETAVTPDDALLDQAAGLMNELVVSVETEVSWRSYAELYLGLIATERGKYRTDIEERQVAFQEARDHLKRAAVLDAVKKEGAQEWESASFDVIPDIVYRQRAVLTELEQIDPELGFRRFRSDFQLSVYSGAQRDTNVVLLGERTDLPRGISNPRDFGFTLGAALDYTVDLGRWDQRLERWTVQFQGRIGQLWQVRIDEFDEQNYGASVAIQYEIMPQRDGVGPLLARLQYDYDYTLLGGDAFAETQSITPNFLLYSFNRRAVSRLYFTYSIRDYREPLYDRRFDRDGEYCRLGFVQSLKTINMAEVYRNWGLEPWGLPGDEALEQDDFDYPDRYLTPFVGLEYGWDATEGDEFDQKMFTLACGAQLPLPYGLTFDAVAEFEWQDYAHGSLVDYHRRGRDNFIQRYSAALSRTFVLQGGELANRYELDVDRVLMTVRAHATWTLDDSNVIDRLGQAIFEYDRAVYGLSLAFSFN